MATINLFLAAVGGFSTIRNRNPQTDGKLKSVAQPLPLPQGMESNGAMAAPSPLMGVVGSAVGGGGVALKRSRYAPARLAKPMKRRLPREESGAKDRFGSGKPSQKYTMMPADDAAPAASEAEGKAEAKEKAKPADKGGAAVASPEVMAAMMLYKGSIGKCYERYAKGASRRLNLRVSVGADGTVTAMKVLKSSGRGPLDRCLRNIFQKHQWAATGQPRQLLIPFVPGKE